MPDRRKHRGRHPQDDELFAGETVDRLRNAVAELSWLLSRGYATVSALKLVGDRHDLTVRQRLAVQRCFCGDAARDGRAVRRIESNAISGQYLAIDGYNLLITIESALSGGLLLVGRDGCMRDLASLHGTYRHVEETIPALTRIFDYIDARAPARIDWYLDRPVSNSGRLKALMADMLAHRRPPGLPPATATWNIELAANPDRILATHPGIVATSDSVVLDACARWTNLARELVEETVQGAWIVDLGDGS